VDLIKTFKQLKKEGKKITVVTSYDYWSAKILNETNVSAILVGDCAAMVMHGNQNTTFADIEVLALHVRAVARGAPDKFIIAAMPIFSLSKGIDEAIDNVKLLIQSGAQAVKIEGAIGNEAVISAIVSAGIPVVGHVGLMPTRHYLIGGFKCQGRDEEDARQIIEQAKKFEELGAFAIVLEAVPKHLGARVCASVEIPVIGIGAGIDCDGQAMVLQDMLGLLVGFKPKFVRRYLDGAKLIQEAINHFVTDVQNQEYPSEIECYN